MAIKLKSLLKTKPLALLLKALVFVGFLYFANLSGFTLVPTLVFLLVALVLYSTPFRNNLAYLTSFLVLVVIAPVAFNAFGNTIGLIVLAIGAGFLFYITLGLKNLFFIYRARWHYLLVLGLFYLLALVFFESVGGSYFFWKLAFVFVAAALLIREFLKATPTYKSPDIGERRIPTGLMAGAGSLLITETLWVISVLPMNVLNSVNLSLVVILILLDILRRYGEGMLTRRAILTNVTIFVLLTLLIFSTSKWGIS